MSERLGRWEGGRMGERLERREGGREVCGGWGVGMEGWGGR